MSIFGSIMSRIFSHPAASPAATAPAVTAPSPEAPAPAADEAPDTPAAAEAAVPPAAAAPEDSQAPAAGSAPAQPVDVDAVLRDMATRQPQPLNYRTSIVDLLKLLDLDSSLSARTALAHELDYRGDTNDSATMNVRLHRAVMEKLEENGGKVPADLKG